MESSDGFLQRMRNALHNGRLHRAARQKTRLMRVGVYLFAAMEVVSAIGFRAFPLSDSGYAGTFQDVMHTITTAIVVLLSIGSLAVIKAAGIKSKSCRSYGICAAIALVMMLVGALGMKIVPARISAWWNVSAFLPRRVLTRRWKFICFATRILTKSCQNKTKTAQIKTKSAIIKRKELKMELYKMENTKENDIIIRQEEEKNYKTTENLVREAFWNVYCPGCKEHYVLHRYRNDPAFVKELDFVMEKDGKMIGQIIYVRSELICDDGKKLPVMTFGPISIAPDYKRKGYGKMLLDFSMERAKKAGAGALIITGNIDFYGKSGFVPAKTVGITYFDDPDADYLLIKELKSGFLNGVKGSYKDPSGYFVCEENPEEFERFEAAFPEKQKLKLPGQLF